MNLTNTIENSFKEYAGEVLLNRALVDNRDALKPSARLMLYIMWEQKLTKGKMVKTASIIGDIIKHYTHGDASATGVLMGLAQPFYMRYPLTKVKGNSGVLTKSGRYGAPRYTSITLSPIGESLFNGIKEDAVGEWQLTADEDKEIPSYLPCKGFFPLTNGTQGIGIGMSSTIPSFNLKEINSALIKLLNNPQISFDEIYCVPDFATGAILINPAEVKESLKNGTGAACKLRSVVSYDQKEHSLIVTEIPYNVYTSSIVDQLEAIVNNEDKLENPGIERFNDMTGLTPKIEIVLEKNASPQLVLNYLYKHTSLQSHYNVNMTVLDKGKRPVVMGWRTLLENYLKNQLDVHRREIEFKLRKIKSRIHILEGFFIVSEDIEKVVKLIKKSKTQTEAKGVLKKTYSLSEAQVVVILKLTLGRLANLEIQKFKAEHKNLKEEALALEAILNEEQLLKKEVQKSLESVMNKFGDERRTRIEEISEESSERLLYVTENGKVYLTIPKKEKVVGRVLSGSKYIAVSRGGYAFRSEKIPARATKVFNLPAGDKLIWADTEIEDGYLSILSHDNKYRCLQVSSLNKIRTKLSLNNLVKASISSEKVTKENFRKQS